MDGSVSRALVGASFQEPDFGVSLAGFHRDSGWRYFKFVNVPHESPSQPVHCPQTAQTQLCRRAGVQPLCRAHPPILWDVVETHISVSHWASPQPKGAASSKDTASMWQPVMW